MSDISSNIKTPAINTRMHCVELINNKILRCKLCPIIYTTKEFYVHPSINKVYLCKGQNHDMQYCHLDGSEILYCKQCFIMFDLKSKEFKHYSVQSQQNIDNQNNIEEYQCMENLSIDKNTNEYQWTENLLFNKSDKINKINNKIKHNRELFYTE